MTVKVGVGVMVRVRVRVKVGVGVRVRARSRFLNISGAYGPVVRVSGQGQWSGEGGSVVSGKG